MTAVMEALRSIDPTKGYVIFDTPSKAKAREIIHYKGWAYQQLAYCLNQRFALVRFPGGEYCLPSRNFGDMSNDTLLAKLYLGEVQIYTPHFLKTLAELTERSSDRLALVRVRDNLQLAITAGMNTHLRTFDLQPNTKVKREEYWYLPDLHEFTRTWQRDLSEDGYIDFTYKALTNAIIDKTDWSQFTTRYKLLRDGNEYYHHAQVLDIKPIASPVLA